MPSEKFEVVIIGGGPVGLVTAYKLGKRGIPCVVIERDVVVPRELRASTFHPPTLDMLEEDGISEELVQLGRPCHSWQIRLHETHEFVEFDLSILKNDTNHPYRLQTEQYWLAEILRDRISRLSSVRLVLGSEVVAIEQGTDSVTVHTEGKDGAQSFVGKFAVGADGARSVTRKSAGMEFKGLTYPETIILATTTFPFEEHLPNLSNVAYLWREGGNFSLLHLKDFWRSTIYPDEGQSIEDALSPENIQAKLELIVPGITYDVHEIRPYRVHMRIVDNFRSHRIILAGDAAHINSPAGGMGMNCGIHDAVLLAECLEKTLQDGSMSYLDAYARKRHEVASREILAQADKNRARMREKDPGKRRETLMALRETMADPDKARAHLLQTSMITALRSAQLVD